MLWPNKKLTQSVTFTEDAADQTLLEAIEKELSLAKYQTFSNLCKQALWQFLSLSEPSTVPPPVVATPTTANLSPHLQRLEERLVELQTRLVELERKMVTEELNQGERINHQFVQLTQQLTQLQSTLNSKLLQVSNGLEQKITELQQAPLPVNPAIESPQPEPPVIPPPPPEEEDPLLKRLGSLLDDF